MECDHNREIDLAFLPISDQTSSSSSREYRNNIVALHQSVYCAKANIVK